jgi:hypothetical protein
MTAGHAIVRDNLAIDHGISLLPQRKAEIIRQPAFRGVNDYAIFSPHGAMEMFLL